MGNLNEVIGLGSEDEVAQCLESIIKVLRLSRAFSKRDEKELRKILKKLEPHELTYLANLFDALYEELSARG